MINGNGGTRLGKPMNFIFVCPSKTDTFETDRFTIIDNRGVRTGEQGQRYLDARVRVDIPCPFCGEHHIYRADELVCPFETHQ